MNETKNIYNLNENSINPILKEFEYSQDYKGFLKAIKEIGNPFILKVFKTVSKDWNNLEGEEQTFWQKFKSLLTKATKTIETTSTVANSANALINKAEPSQTTETTKDNATSKPEILYWAIGALLFISLLMVIVYIINKPH